MRKNRILKNTIVFGFDSAWTNNHKKPGAICAVGFDDGGSAKFCEPVLATFEEAEKFIAEKEGPYKLKVIALDQSIIVNNFTGMRPVEKIAGSAVGWVGGGVQPSNRSRKRMFDDDARIWKFLTNQNTDLDPDKTKHTISGKYIVEVFPALALLGLSENFYHRNGAPRYNPGNPNFKIEDWKSVCVLIEQISNDLELSGLSKWVDKKKKNEKPKKPDQDELDAAICALIGVVWIACEDSCSMMIGNMETGYMITPVIDELRIRLENASKRHGIC